MKKLIHEVVILSLIISFLSNTLATVSHAANPKQEAARKSDKTVLPPKPEYAYDMVPKANGTVSAIPAQKRQEPTTMSEKFLDFLGVKAATPIINPNLPTFSSAALAKEKAQLLAEREANYSELLKGVKSTLDLGTRKSDGSIVFKLNFDKPFTSISIW